ncbi:MAG: T9SS type A sorting domain-containing protein [Bacteroidales bacterium]|jgi:hypothetical protein|nr:T9SS type A sorting domain-containing protein [Bacteroidales bacterium]
MKRILTFIFILFVFQAVTGQTVLNEDFSGTAWPPTGWSIINQSSNWARSQSNNAGGTAPEARMSWSPQFNGVTRLISPELNLVGKTKVIVNFRHNVDHYSANFQIGLATRSGGALGIWNNIWTQTVNTTVMAEQKIFVVENSDVNTSDFQICLFFNGNSYNINYWYIDNVEISLVNELDAAMGSISVPDVFAGPQTVSGTVNNLGSTSITSMNINWQINEGDINTTSFLGLDIPTAGSVDFTCEQQIDLDPGTYQLIVWVSDINGFVGDDVPDNDTIIKTITIVDQASIKKPLFEEFTSSTCGPCASFNNSVMNPFYNQYGQNFTLIKYQMNWPGSGDPYYTAEAGVRRTFYGVNAVPMLFVEGADVQTGMGAVTAAYNNAISSPAFVEINSQHLIENYDITIKATITAHVNINNAIVHMVVVEKTTVNNVGGNGETSFKHVMMKMLPNATGTVANLIAGEPYTLQYSRNLANTYVEEMDDLAVVVFVQNNANKSVYQSAYSEEVTSFGLPGDSNCDDLVNVLDVVNTVNYILGAEPEPFCFENADVNADGVINVVDVVATVNIIITGNKSANIPIKSKPAFLNIDNDKISLLSDGTLAGLQFELEGVKKDDITFVQEGYECEMAENNGKLTVVVFSFINKPLPSGNIDLVTFKRKIESVVWGEAIAANLNANEVKVIRQQNNQTSNLNDFFKENIFPNPSSGNIDIEINLKHEAEVQIKLTDKTGRELTAFNKVVWSAGNYTVKINEHNNLSSGIYFINFLVVPTGSYTPFSKAAKVMIVH